MKTYLYIGRFYPRCLIKTLRKDSRNKAGGMSNHNFEMSVINGLLRQEGIAFKCLTYPSVYSYPYNNKRFYTKKESYKYNSTHIYSIGFCNLLILKELWSIISLAIQIVRYSCKQKCDKIDIIINTPNINILTAIKFAKLLTRKRITQTVIIPDIPSMVTAMTKTNSFKGKLLNLMNRYLMKELSSVDGLVLLTDYMMDFIANKSISHITMEGVVDIETMATGHISGSSEREVILYTGTLLKMFGVMNLVKAFQRIDNDGIELWLCGAGDSIEDIEAAAREDKRIKFYGLVDSQTALSLQRQATILVNPRTTEGEYTKYSFPSKTLEYLLAGKNVIINRLEGIPDEYYKYVFTPKDESVEALANCIIDVLKTDTAIRKEKAKAGRDFVVNNKNSQVQVSRILKMISAY